MANHMMTLNKPKYKTKFWLSDYSKMNKRVLTKKIESRAAKRSLPKRDGSIWIFHHLTILIKHKLLFLAKKKNTSYFSVFDWEPLILVHINNWCISNHISACISIIHSLNEINFFFIKKKSRCQFAESKIEYWIHLIRFQCVFGTKLNKNKTYYFMSFLLLFFLSFFLFHFFFSISFFSFF